MRPRVPFEGQRQLGWGQLSGTKQWACAVWAERLISGAHKKWKRANEGPNRQRPIELKIAGRLEGASDVVVGRREWSSRRPRVLHFSDDELGGVIYGHFQRIVPSRPTIYPHVSRIIAR